MSEQIVIKEQVPESRPEELSAESRGYRLHMDVLRIIAAFLVIVNHTNSRVFLGTEPSVTWYGSVAYFFI